MHGLDKGLTIEQPSPELVTTALGRGQSRQPVRGCIPRKDARLRAGKCYHPPRHAIDVHRHGHAAGRAALCQLRPVQEVWATAAVQGQDDNEGYGAVVNTSLPLPQTGGSIAAEHSVLPIEVSMRADVIQTGWFSQTGHQADHGMMGAVCKIAAKGAITAASITPSLSACMMSA